MKKKIPIYTLLKAFGISDKKIIYSLEKERLINNLNKTSKIKTSKSIMKIYEFMFGKDINLVRFKKISMTKIY